MTIPHYDKEKPHPGPEDALQAATARWLKAQHPNLLAFHVPNGGKRPLSTVRRRGQLVQAPIIAAKLKQGGALAGVSDWLILEPRGEYHGLVIELKAKGGGLESSQIEFLFRCQDRNYFIAVAWSLDGFMEVVNTYLELGQ